MGRRRDEPAGRDDRGRPGALGFHGLFLTPWEYGKAGSSPFVFTPALRSSWTAETTTLPSGLLPAPGPVTAGTSADRRADGIARALATGRRVAVESPAPIDDLARQVWDALPPRVRARLSVATWAFGNANGFDLLAVPRLAGVVLDGSYDLDAGAGGGEVVWQAPSGLVRDPPGRLQSGP